MFQTNDINVAKLEVAYELCKGVQTIDGKSSSTLNTDLSILIRAGLIKKVVSELTKAPQTT